MLSKPISEITFEDVVAFCERQIRENAHLDYKLDFPPENEKLAKTIASFANSRGGLLLIGVADDGDDKPLPPFDGLAFRQGMSARIEQIIAHNINPPVFVEIGIPQHEDRAFVVVRIPQSRLTPHSLVTDNGIYIRTGQSSNPENLAHPEQLPWLFEHRRKSEELRDQLLNGTIQRLDNIAYLSSLARNLPIGCISVLPALPSDPLFEFTIAREVLRHITFDYGILGEFPTGLALRSIPGGIAVLSDTNDPLDCTSFELHDKGLLSFVESFGHREIKFLNVIFDICRVSNSFIALMNQTGYYGDVLIRYQLHNAAQKRVVDLDFPGVRPRSKFSPGPILDEVAGYEFAVSSSYLKEQTEACLTIFLQKLAWSLGLGAIDKDVIVNAIRGNKMLKAL